MERLVSCAQSDELKIRWHLAGPDFHSWDEANRGCVRSHCQHEKNNVKHVKLSSSTVAIILV